MTVNMQKIEKIYQTEKWKSLCALCIVNLLKIAKLQATTRLHKHQTKIEHLSKTINIGIFNIFKPSQTFHNFHKENWRCLFKFPTEKE